MKLNLASTRLAFVLIALLAAHLILSAIIPQVDIATGQLTDWRDALGEYYQVVEFLRLDRIYTFPAFYALLGLLGLNLLVGNVRRFRTVYRVERTLLKARHLGSIVFHLGLLSVLAAIIANYLYKYDGVLALTAGQRVVDIHEAYFREFLGPLRYESYERFQIQLDSVDLDFQIAGSPTTAAFISVWPPREPVAQKATIYTNRPFVIDELEIHYGLTYGYSPELSLIDSAGSSQFTGFVRLATQAAEGAPVFKDFYVHTPSGLHVEMNVLPHELDIDSSQISLHIDRAGEALSDTTVNLQDTVFVDGWRITFPRLRRWCYLTVVENPQLGTVFFSLWLALAGLTITFVPRVLKKGSKSS